MQECRQGSNNTFELLLKNIKDVGLEFSTPTPGNGDCFFEAVSDQLKRLHLPYQNPIQLRHSVVKFCKENATLKVFYICNMY